MKKDITNDNDIKLMVNVFYSKVRNDALLKDIFNDAIQEDGWSKHLEKMYSFWQTVLLIKKSYYGNPFMPHAKLTVESHHFRQWLSLFSETVNELFVGEKSEKCKWQASRMAEMFQKKINSNAKI